MRSRDLPFPWMLLFLLAASTANSLPLHKIPRLNPIGLHLREANTILAPVPSDFRTSFYDQTLDHFNYNPQSYATFKQRYLVNSKFWGGSEARAPIFAYLGAEAPIDGDVAAVGFLAENAPRFEALVVFIEHRYYGESNVVGSFEQALQNATARGYFNSAQALADYAEILLHIKKDMSADESPIIVFGGSYGGMLASWFRLKYPHVALGALASSAPILYFDDITPQDGYYSVVTKDFKQASETCYATVRGSWEEIKRVASKPGGLSILSKRFKTCGELKSAHELEDYLDTMYSGAAQYNAPPSYPVSVVCGGIGGAPDGTDVIGRVIAGLVAYRPNRTCYNTTRISDETNSGWQWQTCSEMSMPIGITRNDSMFPVDPYDLNAFIDECKGLFGVTPRPHWITTYFGGHDIKSVLKKFGSNIIFSNGLRDPYSSAGVLEDISESILAVHTTNGSHCLDIMVAKDDDPQWLVDQRKREVDIIRGWIDTYNSSTTRLSRKK